MNYDTANAKAGTYVGIADAHGIESFRPESESKGIEVTVMVMRAKANRQRHAVCYRVDIPDANAVRRVMIQLNSNRYQEALKTLKRVATNIKLGGGGNVAASWGMIPNSKLDPWAGGVATDPTPAA